MRKFIKITVKFSINNVSNFNEFYLFEWKWSIHRKLNFVNIFRWTLFVPYGIFKLLVSCTCIHKFVCLMGVCVCVWVCVNLNVIHLWMWFIFILFLNGKDLFSFLISLAYIHCRFISINDSLINVRVWQEKREHCLYIN